MLCDKTFATEIMNLGNNKNTVAAAGDEASGKAFGVAPAGQNRLPQWGDSPPRGPRVSPG